jgi:hypothetical protein
MSLDSEKINDAMKFYDKAKGHIAVLVNCIRSYGPDSRWTDKVKEEQAESELERDRNKVSELISEIDEKYSDVPTALELKRILQEGLSRLEKVALPYLN